MYRKEFYYCINYKDAQFVACNGFMFFSYIFLQKSRFSICALYWSKLCLYFQPLFSFHTFITCKNKMVLSIWFGIVVNERDCELYSFIPLSSHYFYNKGILNKFWLKFAYSILVHDMQSYMIFVCDTMFTRFSTKF